MRFKLNRLVNISYDDNAQQRSNPTPTLSWNSQALASKGHDLPQCPPTPPPSRYGCSFPPFPESISIVFHHAQLG